MPGVNPLVQGNLLSSTAADPIVGQGSSVNGRGIVAGIGPVHLTLIGMIVVAAAGLVLLHKVGFRFSVTVGGRAGK